VLLRYATCLRTLGQVQETTGQLSDAEAYFRQAIGVVQTFVGANESEQLERQTLLANCQQGLGIAVAQQDRFDEAREQYLESIAIFEEIVAKHPLVISYREDLCGVKYSLAVTQLLTQHYDEAAQLIGEIVGEFETLGEQYPDQRLTFLDRSGKDYNLLYVIRSRQKDWDGAREAIEAGLRCFDTVLAERPNWFETNIARAELIGNYGNLLLNLQQYDEALAKYQQAREWIRPINQQQPDHARALQTLISSYTGPVAVHTNRKQYDLALEELREALKIRNDERMANELLHEIWLLDRLGRFEEAQSALNSFLDRFADSSQMKDAAAKKAKELLKFHAPIGDTPDPDATHVKPPPEYLQRLASLVGH
jgi:tetratricopeptide (TPR) repeat protein